MLKSLQTNFSHIILSFHLSSLFLVCILLSKIQQAGGLFLAAKAQVNTVVINWCFSCSVSAQHGTVALDKRPKHVHPTLSLGSLSMASCKMNGKCLASGRFVKITFSATSESSKTTICLFVQEYSWLQNSLPLLSEESLQCHILQSFYSCFLESVTAYPF